MSDQFAAGMRRAAEELWPMIEAAKELRGYASYAEMTGGISVNRPQIREWCDKVLERLPRDEFGFVAEGPSDAILAAIPASAPWTPPDDRADGFECLGWRREGEWEPVKWLAYMDRWWWIFTDNATGQPTAFAPLPPAPEDAK